MKRATCLIALTAFPFWTARAADDAVRKGQPMPDEVRQQKAATPGTQPGEKPGPLKETIRGGIAFVPEKRQWVRITGKATVLNAHTLLFEDGTEVDLSGGMEAPELEQKGLIGGSFYPCGREAAEFLRNLIGNQTVTCYANKEHAAGKKMWIASGFVGETELGIELVRNGWAVSDHSGMDAWEIIARENKRGLWRGQFVVPKKWRQGERLPGE